MTSCVDFKDFIVAFIFIVFGTLFLFSVLRTVILKFSI